jgi:hypothetical protein
MKTEEMTGTQLAVKYDPKSGDTVITTDACPGFNTPFAGLFEDIVPTVPEEVMEGLDVADEGTEQPTVVEREEGPAVETMADILACTQLQLTGEVDDSELALYTDTDPEEPETVQKNGPVDMAVIAAIAQRCNDEAPLYGEDDEFDPNADYNSVPMVSIASETNRHAAGEIAALELMADKQGTSVKKLQEKLQKKRARLDINPTGNNDLHNEYDVPINVFVMCRTPQGIASVEENGVVGLPHITIDPGDDATKDRRALFAAQGWDFKGLRVNSYRRVEFSIFLTADEATPTDYGSAKPVYTPATPADIQRLGLNTPNSDIVQAFFNRKYSASGGIKLYNHPVFFHGFGQEVLDALFPKDPTIQKMSLYQVLVRMSGRRGHMVCVPSRKYGMAYDIQWDQQSPKEIRAVPFRGLDRAYIKSALENSGIKLYTICQVGRNKDFHIVFHDADPKQ